MKARVFCKLEFGNQFGFDLEKDDPCNKALSEAITWFGYQSKINAQYSFGMKDYEYALKFYSAYPFFGANKFEASGYTPLTNWLNKQRGYFKTIVDVVNKKYPNNDFNLYYYPNFTIDFAIEDSDVWHVGDNDREFGEATFKIQLFPAAKNSKYNDKLKLVTEKIQDLYSQYGFRSIFKFSERFKIGVCSVLEHLDPREALQVYNRYNTSEEHKERIQRIEKSFDDTIKNLKNKYDIDSEGIDFAKVYGFSIKLPLTDDDIY